MDLGELRIDADIRRARSLPGWAYTSPELHRRILDRVFARTWHYAADLDRLKVPGACLPLCFLEGSLDEPLLFARDRSDRLHCLSNVCTHRGALVCNGEGVESVLRCRYHGRRFDLDGRFVSMPEFEGAADFPTAADDLARVPFAAWGKLAFAALEPGMSFAELTAELNARVGWLPLDRAVLDPSRSRDYAVQANWALYCDNYLEGFHIPYVHASLASAIDYGAYRTELFRWGSVQVGAAAGAEGNFDLPRSSPDHGQRIAAYYVWLFPATMVNVYPWGVSLNAVRPLGVDRTRVSFRSFVWDSSLLERGAGSGLDRVEREDEAVVEDVHRGCAARLRRAGRYSPTREAGVHHFHRLLASFLAE